MFNLRTSLNSKAKPEKKYCKKMDGIGARRGRRQIIDFGLVEHKVDVSS